MIRYSTISLPKELYDQLQHMVEKKPDMGYSSVADFCKEAIRLHVQEIKKELREDFLRKIEVPLLFKKIERLSAIDEGTYGELFENMGCMACMFSPNFIIKECNYAFFSNLGYSSKDELIGRDIEEVFLDPKLKGRIKRETLRDYEIQALRKDGKVLDVLLSVSFLKSRQYIAVAKDVTVKNYLIDKEEKTRELYEYLIDEMCHTVLVIQDQKIKFVNKAVHMTGWTREDFVGKIFVDFVPPHEHERALDNYAKAIEGIDLGEPRIYEFVTKKGKVIKGELSSRKIVFDGRPALLVAVRYKDRC
jgi:PAS domain S-box-containing protein